jgi:hypothetical protein
MALAPLELPHLVYLAIHNDAECVALLIDMLSLTDTQLAVYIRKNRRFPTQTRLTPNLQMAPVRPRVWLFATPALKYHRDMRTATQPVCSSACFKTMRSTGPSVGSRGSFALSWRTHSVGGGRKYITTVHTRNIALSDTCMNAVEEDLLRQGTCLLRRRRSEKGDGDPDLVVRASLRVLTLLDEEVLRTAARGGPHQRWRRTEKCERGGKGCVVPCGTGARRHTGLGGLGRRLWG